MVGRGLTVKALAAAPVAVYGATLVGMVGVALNRRGRVSKTSFGFVFGGAMVFLLSDSLIGLHFLAAPGLIPAGGFWIMLTYLVAEGMIAAGLITQAEADFGAHRA